MKRLGNPRSATLAALLLATSLWLGLAATTRAEAVDTSSHASAAAQTHGDSGQGRPHQDSRSLPL